MLKFGFFIGVLDYNTASLDLLYTAHKLPESVLEQLRSGPLIAGTQGVMEGRRQKATSTLTAVANLRVCKKCRIKVNKFVKEQKEN